MTGLEIVASVVELAGGMREIARKDPANRATVREVINALRTIYFTPSGTITLIEQLAKGERPSAEQVATILPEFNDNEWCIIRELQRLDFEALYKSRDLSIRQCRILEEISHGKKNLRASIQDFLNEAMTTNRMPSAKDAQQLLDRVQELNSLIEDADEGLR